MKVGENGGGGGAAVGGLSREEESQVAGARGEIARERGGYKRACVTARVPVRLCVCVRAR